MAAVIAGMRIVYAALDPDNLHGAIPNEVTNPWAGQLFFNPIARLPEFAMGVLSASIFLQSWPAIQRIPRSRIWTAAGTAGIIVVLLVTSTYAAWDRVWFAPTVAVMFTFLIMMIATNRLGFVSKFLALPALVLLGEASYSMYVFQRPVAQYLNVVLVRSGRPTVENDWYSLGAFLVILTVVSIAAYKWLEVPARKYLRKRLTQGTQPS